MNTTGVRPAALARATRSSVLSDMEPPYGTRTAQSLWDPAHARSSRDLRSSGGAAGTRSGRRQFSDGVADRGDHDERLVEAADLQNAPDYRLWTGDGQPAAQWAD